MTPSTALPYLGFGMRLRRDYLPRVVAEKPDVDWFEIISENHLDESAETLAPLLRIRADYPLVMHGISLGIGSPWPLDRGYLARLRRLADVLEPPWVSDHLCWRGVDEMQGSLLPVPYSTEMLEHVVARIERVQEVLGRPVLLENVPYEPAGTEPEIPEAVFIDEVARRSGSLILIDVGNLLASTRRTGISAEDYLDRIAPAHLQQVHLGGAIALCDAAADAVDDDADPIWALYALILRRFGRISTMIEREDTIAPLDEMVLEVSRARCSASAVLAAQRPAV